MKVAESIRVPEGFVFVDWQDVNGTTWKDTFLIQVFERMKKDSRGIVIKRVITPRNHRR